MTKIKITTEFNPYRYHFMPKRGEPKRGNFCKGCGAPLTDPVSISRGYGKRCWNDVPVIIVLDIPAGETK